MMGMGMKKRNGENDEKEKIHVTTRSVMCLEADNHDSSGKTRLIAT